MLLPLLFLFGGCCAKCCTIDTFAAEGIIVPVADVMATTDLGLADVIAKWQMEKPLVADVITTLGVVGRCYSQVADGIATGQCLNFHSDVLCNTSSQM